MTKTLTATPGGNTHAKLMEVKQVSAAPQLTKSSKGLSIQQARIMFWTNQWKQERHHFPEGMDITWASLKLVHRTVEEWALN